MGATVSKRDDDDDEDDDHKIATASNFLVHGWHHISIPLSTRAAVAVVRLDCRLNIDFNTR